MMMETIDGGCNYMQIVQHGVHLNLNSALCSLVTPPRRTIKTNKKRISTPVDIPPLIFQSPPLCKAPENRSKSLPKGSATRYSPSRLSPSQLDSADGFYAGAKFWKRPPPTELPKPPNHWVSDRENKLGPEEQSCLEMTNTLKVLLKVQS